jgi:hypothetical protein
LKNIGKTAEAATKGIQQDSSRKKISTVIPAIPG